jgi:hypothetical protein
MRIICDHCDRPISGTVKRLPGNFNLHPDCLAQFDKAPKDGANAAVWASQESSNRHVGRVEAKPTVRFTRGQVGRDSPMYELGDSMFAIRTYLFK